MGWRWRSRDRPHHFRKRSALGLAARVRTMAPTAPANMMAVASNTAVISTTQSGDVLKTNEPKRWRVPCGRLACRRRRPTRGRSEAPPASAVPADAETSQEIADGIDPGGPLRLGRRRLVLRRDLGRRNPRRHVETVPARNLGGPMAPDGLNPLGRLGRREGAARRQKRGRLRRQKGEGSRPRRSETVVLSLQGSCRRCRGRGRIDPARRIGPPLTVGVLNATCHDQIRLRLRAGRILPLQERRGRDET